MTAPPAAPDGCPICADNVAAEAGTEPWTVARLRTGYLRLSYNQYFAGAAFFVARACVRELHDLDPAIRSLHLHEMSEVAAAICDAFSPHKFNYESLGNQVPHLHWWLTPRYLTDPHPNGPIWEDPGFHAARQTGSHRPDDEERLRLGQQMLTALREHDVVVEQAYMERNRLT